MDCGAETHQRSYLGCTLDGCYPERSEQRLRNEITALSPPWAQSRDKGHYRHQHMACSSEPLPCNAALERTVCLHHSSILCVYFSPVIALFCPFKPNSDNPCSLTDQIKSLETGEMKGQRLPQ